MDYGCNFIVKKRLLERERKRGEEKEGPSEIGGTSTHKSDDEPTVPGRTKACTEGYGIHLLLITTFKDNKYSMGQIP